jgi:hypothetical protein
MADEEEVELEEEEENEAFLDFLIDAREYDPQLVTDIVRLLDRNADSFTEFFFAVAAALRTEQFNDPESAIRVEMFANKFGKFEFDRDYEDEDGE